MEQAGIPRSRHALNEIGLWSGYREYVQARDLEQTFDTKNGRQRGSTSLAPWRRCLSSPRDPIRPNLGAYATPCHPSKLAVKQPKKLQTQGQSAPMDWTRGTHGLLIGFTLSCGGVLVGLISGRAPATKVLAFPLIAVPFPIVAVLLWTAMAGPLQATAIASNLIPYLGLIFIGLFSGLAGKLFAKLPQKEKPPTRHHSRRIHTRH